MATGYRLYIRLSPDQRKEIEARAAEVGISPSNYSRQRALGTLKAKADDKAIRQLTAIGYSLNQIARHLNSDGEEAAELRETMAEVRAAVAALKKTEQPNDHD